MPTFKDYFFDSSSGVNKIHARQCIPDSAPKATVQIAHGIAEHIERYDDFAMFLASNGFVVVGNDHLGHGQSISKPEEQGFFALSNGWSCVVEDMNTLRELTVKEYPGIPYVFFGHSMGSFLTRTYLIKYPDSYDAAIISGTGHQGKAMVLGGLTMANLFVRLHGVHYPGDALNNIAFGTYNDGFENPRTPFDWLSRDPSVVDKYIADPLCGFVPTVGLFRDMMGGIKFITSQKNINMMNKERPIYFMSGAADPVGENGKGVERAYKAFCSAGLHDIYMKLYPEGRHEMLNELNNKEVYANILAWINEKLGF